MCFEFLGFPVECVEAGCWSLVFRAFLLIAVTSDMAIAVLGVQNLPFGKPGAFTSTPGAILALGDALGTMGAAGRAHRGPEPDFW